MDPNKRPDDMVRITTPELAQAFIDRAGRGPARPDRRRQGAARPLRRCRLARGGRAAHQAPWASSSSACTSTTASCARASPSRWSTSSRTRWTPTSCTWTPPTASSTCSSRRGRARAQAQDHRRRVHPRVRGGGPQGRRRGRLPGPGHHLPRHPRVQDGVKAHHNVGGLPEDLQFELGRAGQAALQGRGARRGPRARPARVHGGAPAVPRPRPGRALPRRHHARPPERAARGRRHPARGVCERRARRQACGSTSPWCPTCAPPACATASAPTSGRPSSAPSTPWTP